MSTRPKIGISACFFHADPARPIFTGKTLQYVEQSIVHWVQSSGALALVIPSPDGPTQRGDVTLADYAGLLDGLVLEGGSDMWPGSYGEEPLRPEWSGDRIRDDYEIALLRAFVDAGKPVLGICRGLQVINVAFGGTLYQDIATQLAGAIEHRNAKLYDQNFHTIEFVPGTRLAELYPHPGFKAPDRPLPHYVVNSVHHQGIKELAPFFDVEARCPNDGVIEAVRYDSTRGPVQSYVAAVQWHPEFHDWNNETVLAGDPLLNDFIAATRAAQGDSLVTR
ncbi:MAG: peptidase [Burkholderiaceae bacterium]|jgi:putative glutamine amidotransferase|nr:peptidase [Burkholderiaceae bacterium]